MAKALESFEFSGRSTSSTYDWTTLLNGQIWQLVQGDDFQCKPSTFGALARRQAKHKGVALNVAIRGNSITVQAVVGSVASTESTESAPETTSAKVRPVKSSTEKRPRVRKAG